MKKQAEWVDASLMRAFEAEGTDAHRLCTIEDGWVERFGREIVISYKTQEARDRLTLELYVWKKSVDFDFLRIFARFLPKKNEQREKPQLIFGDRVANPETIAMEHFLKYAIDFDAGYSVGFFIDQRENRRYLRVAPARRVLNCFAYTCSFSVAAASVGASTVNVDLSRKSLERGRRNFALNSLSNGEHKFVADDVMAVLPRLARKGEKFDTIILDPPTFSRSHRGSTFHVESDFEDLLATAIELAEREGRILLSTNCTTLNDKTLEVMARYCLKRTRRAGSFLRTASLPDFPPATAASTVWLTLR
jgi:23S rRNA (cytosine1962-C5)-methyltransferase